MSILDDDILDDDIVLKSKKDGITGVLHLDRTDGKIAYFDLLKQIKDKKLDTNGLTICDDKNKFWIWSDDINGFLNRENSYGFNDSGYVIYLTEEYDDLDLVDLLVTILTPEMKENAPEFAAKQKIISEIESMYMDLNMEIDNCQGCMEHLDIALEQLNIYKDIVKYLGGDIDSHIKELTEKWFEKVHKENEIKEKEKAKRDSVIQKLQFPVTICSVGNVTENIVNTLFKHHDKINEICELLIQIKNNS